MFLPSSPAQVDPRPGHALFHSRYTTLASNTIDYWMMPPDLSLTHRRLEKAVADAPVLKGASLQLYLHVPFCRQRCRFCAFSGGNHLPSHFPERYSELLVWQIQDLLARTQISGHPVRSVHIGGGSPDLLGPHIATVLRAVRDLPGVSASTEIAVEFTLSTTQKVFIDALVDYGVTKASFGLQSLDPKVRRWMRLPKDLRHLDKVLDWIQGRIPIVNADLITGLPGQTLGSIDSDLQTLLHDPRIQAISSYLLTPGAAPSLIAGLVSGELPPQPQPAEQAMMRLHTYTSFLRHGWLRRGTNTYVNPRALSDDILARISGNECIGGGHYEAFVLGAGAQAVSSLPGVRLENIVDLHEWCARAEQGEQPWFVPKCALAHQRDQALWAFPLRHEGLSHDRWQTMLDQKALSPAQQQTWQDLQNEGLIHRTLAGYQLTLLGEVFMGHLVRDLKSPTQRAIVDDYIEEGLALGQSAATGAHRDNNALNNRQTQETREPSAESKQRTVS